MSPEMPDVNPEIPSHAVSVISSDPSDEFPVLKAFQQYVDAEQSKSRKRMLLLSIFFVALMSAIVAVFLILLNNASERNQKLNDRLIEYVMKSQEVRQQQPAVVVQSPSDNAALLSRLEQLQKKMDESQKAAMEAEAARRVAEAERAAKEAAEKAVPKGPTPEELEIKRLKALLSSERKKAEAERARKHQEEIEAYRRKHYPELYQDDDASEDVEADEIDRLIEDLEDDNAINYFESTPKAPSRPKTKKRAKQPVYTIPVEANGSKRAWSIPD